MKKAIKWLLIIMGSLLVIGFISSIGSDKSKTYTPALDKGPSTAKDLIILQSNAKTESLNGETHITIDAVVQNNSSQLMDYVQVSASFYDKNGKVVGTGMGNTTNLAAGAKRTIEVIGINIDSAARYELEITDHP
ncbi:FxLYD domain-containing protein [Dinghuibacter silviterrae]|uniref:DUF3426 domain-containing protein n=1 Tax=Dinghuibacter silviterrae TaxID=1539049 RepID=A0A4R8DPM6_9BACT|nr:FxLYD domain-containing protein [Dinghuibacter silviterrae]TDW99364.1 hypothetical protein EDB95_0374 [Dinghuibacter silviterrae]